MRFLRAEHPEAVAAVVVAAHQPDTLKHPHESVGDVPVHGLAEPCLGHRGGLHGRCAGGPQQMASPGDVQLVRRGDCQRSLAPGPGPGGIVAAKNGSVPGRSSHPGSGKLRPNAPWHYHRRAPARRCAAPRPR